MRATGPLGDLDIVNIYRAQDGDSVREGWDSHASERHHEGIYLSHRNVQISQRKVQISPSSLQIEWKESGYDQDTARRAGEIRIMERGARASERDSSGSWDPDVGRQDERSPDTEDKDRTSG